MTLYPWQEKSWSSLAQDKSKMHHAYIFVGDLGAGLHRYSNIFARSLICGNLTDTNLPCGKCHDCHLLMTQHPNLKIIDNSVEDSASKNISIESIRGLKRFFELSSHKVDGKKVILINNTESLTLNAANALLKLLEEPPENSYIILTTHNVSSLLPTIVSRCSIVTCPKPTAVEAKDFLNFHGYEHLSSQLNLFNNLPLDVIDNQDDLGLYETIINEFEKGKNLELMKIDSKWFSGDFPSIISLFQKWLYDIFLFKLTKQFKFFGNKKENIKKLSDAADISKLVKLVMNVYQVKLISNKPINKDIAFDNLMIEYKNIFK